MPKNKAITLRAGKNARLDITLHNIADSIEDELVVIDTEYRLSFANSAALGRLPKGARSPVGKLCYQVFHGRDRPCATPLWDCPLRKVIESHSVITVVHPILIAGVEKYLKITAYPVKDNDGNIKGIVELRRDVTAERELETQILRRHHQLLALSHISRAVSGLQDLETVLRIALDNVLEIVNGTIGGILLLDKKTKTLYYRVQHGLSARFAEETRVPLGEGIAGRVAQTGQPMLLEDISKDERAVQPYLISAEGLKGFISIPLKVKGEVVGVMNIASHKAGRFGADDMSLLDSIGDYLGTAIEQASLSERLTSAGERYQRLLQHTLTAQEEERKRISRELHDETSQALTSLTLSLQALIQMAEMKGIKDAEFTGILEKVHSYAVHAGNEIVKLMKELRPTLLDELGLPAAIHRYAKDTLQTQGIDISTEFIGTDERFPSQVEVTLFRITQGVIGNILEHSGAKNASIKLECDDTECVLRIEDDGKGFNVDKLTQVEPSGRGAGLFTMKERVRLVGGTCHIESRPGHGTKIVAKIPLLSDIVYEEDKDPNSR